MQELVNEAVISMVNDGLISMNRIRELIEIKEFIDRIATRTYIDDYDAHKLLQKFGVMPNMRTWGDYFQTDLASALVVVSDEEFERILDTIKFDVISSYIIFSEKEDDFFMWVDETYNEITSSKSDHYDEEEEEIIHLKILMDYFNNMGIVNNFTEAEMTWYSTYSEAMAV